MSPGIRGSFLACASLIAVACASPEELVPEDSGATAGRSGSSGSGGGPRGSGGTGGSDPTTTGGATGGTGGSATGGTGGTTGTGGTAGTAGSSGTGGTGTGGAVPDASVGDAAPDRPAAIDAGACTTCKLRVQYRASDTNATDNQIKPHFNIVNVGTTSVPLGELTIRYWYTAEGNRPQMYWCDYAMIGCANVTGKLVTMTTPEAGADSYLEIGFTAGAGTLAPNGQTGEIQNRFNKDNYANYNEVDDYSFDPARTAFTDWMRVTLYHNGGLVWGTDPACANPGDGASCGTGSDAGADVAPDTVSTDVISDSSSTDASSSDVTADGDARPGDTGSLE